MGESISGTCLQILNSVDRAISNGLDITNGEWGDLKANSDYWVAETKTCPLGSVLDGQKIKMSYISDSAYHLGKSVGYVHGFIAGIDEDADPENFRKEDEREGCIDGRTIKQILEIEY